MPRMKNGVRDYSYDTSYEASTLQKKHRAARNAARNTMADAGKVRKGDGKDVDHIKPLKSGGAGRAKSNLRVLPRGKNRGRK